MSQSILQSIRGMNDILPDNTAAWQLMEQKLRETIQAYGYREIRLPVMENTALFKRAIGEVTDIVEKEMYTFLDRNEESISLRPEGTAGCVRACLQHHLLYNQTQRLWYAGPMFRYERPQKGRYRQFYQLGVEAYGMPGVDIEMEILMMGARLWEVLGVSGVTLEVNTLGTAEERSNYRESLIGYFQNHITDLDEDSQRRLHTNPLRILDSKNPSMQALIEAAPKLIDDLQKNSRERFDELCRRLGEAGIQYRINTRLVRGLDYYSHTVFEWVTDKLGAQGTICAGGRYDALVSQLGGAGNDTPAFGFGLGMERLLMLVENNPDFAKALPKEADIYVVLQGEEAERFGALWVERELRPQLPQCRIIVHCGGGSMKSQLKKADKSEANAAVIFGETEIKNKTVCIKFLREDRPQEEVSLETAADFLKSVIITG